jgi:hypothetical protein
MMAAELMRMLTTSGVQVLAVEIGSEAASAIGRHWNAVKDFLHTGDTGGLEPFRGLRILGYRFETDPDRIERWAQRGELDFEDIYESSGWS